MRPVTHNPIFVTEYSGFCFRLMQTRKMLPEGKTSYEVARFYAVSTAVYAPVTCLALFVSGAYLQAGNSSYLPACTCLAVAELLKYVYVQLAYHKDISLKPKQGTDKDLI